jgi:2-polyprenyl-6-methoxyphenol hydroxylase-like FAD-dependent oxidoreductase
VIICGCGPTGALLSAYLGKMNISNIVLEKGAEITTDPRGIALDEDGIRLLQGAGLYSSVYTEIGTCKVTPIAINNMRNTVRPLIQTKKAG